MQENLQNNYCIDLFCVESYNFLIYEPTLKWAHFELSQTSVDNKVMIGDLDITGTWSAANPPLATARKTRTTMRRADKPVR